MIDFESALQSTLTRLTNEHSHTELDPYTFHPSQLAKCPRQCYASKLGLLDNTDSYGTFRMGIQIHEFMEQQVGPYLDVETQREQPIQMEVDGLTIVGHADCYEPDADIVYDYKSRANWYRFSPPIERHLDQIYIYMRALNASRGQIVYISRADLEVQTWPPQSAGIDTFAFEPARFQDLIAKGKRIAATIIEHGYPTAPDEIPFEKCDCWFCKQETLQFDHLQSDIDPVTADKAAADAASTNDGHSAAADTTSGDASTSTADS